jgi:hypothetical protein
VRRCAPGSRQRPRLAPWHGSPQRNGQLAKIPTVLVAFIGVVVMAIAIAIATGKPLSWRSLAFLSSLWRSSALLTGR